MYLSRSPDEKTRIEKARLETRISRNYRTTREQFEVGGATIDFLRVTDPDVVLDQVAMEEDRREKLSGQRVQEPLHLPYWAELWDSSEAIARWIGEHRERFHNRTKTLDLGCGMGLCGAAAAAMGAEVLLADLEPPALLLARRNCICFQPHIRARRTNWQTDQLGERFDVILGGDILYERKQWEFLERFWRAHLTDGGSIMLGEPGRQTGDLFPEWIVTCGWRIEKRSGIALRREKSVRLFELRLK